MATSEVLIRADSTPIIFTHPSEYSAQTNGVIGTRTTDADIDALSRND